MAGSDGKLIAVIGGGISGITTALEAAEAGREVLIIEREAYLGGRVARNSKYYPKLCPPSCGLEINFKRIARNPNVSYYTMAQVVSASRSAGGWDLTVRIEPRYVNEKCTACGKCAEACETKIPNPFNLELDDIKAAYLPHPMAFPQRYVLSPKIAGTDEGRRCKEACRYEAIDLDMKPREVKVRAAAVVVATGWRPYDAARIEPLGYGKVKDVVTNVMMERYASPSGPTGGKIVRPSDGGPIGSVAFAQCAGSRDENHLPYCSAVCCMASLKQAALVREQYPDAKITVYYIDLRAMGKYEDVYARLQADPNIAFVRGKVAKITTDQATGGPVAEVEDTLAGTKVEARADLFVLATGIVPNAAGPEFPIPLERDEFGFAVRRTAVPGVCAAGCARKPASVAQCTQDATGAALRAIQAAAGS